MPVRDKLHQQARDFSTMTYPAVQGEFLTGGKGQPWKHKAQGISGVQDWQKVCGHSLDVMS